MINLVNVMAYCRDWTEIENYEKAITDKENMWVCHHRWETNDPERPCTKAELIEAGHYYNVPAFDLIFLTKSEHAKIHKLSSFRGKHLSEEYKKSLSEAQKGKHHSEETKKKMSESHKGKEIWNKGKKGFLKGRKLSEETKLKMSEARKKYWENKKYGN